METLQLQNYRHTICEFLWKQYVNNSLCDVVINTSDGQQIHAHRIVLAAFSDFFCQQIEMQNMTTTVAIVFNVDYNYDCMKALIDFMYNGKLDIPKSGNSHLFSAAVNLNISSVQSLLLKSCSSSCLSGKKEKNNIEDSSNHQSDTDFTCQDEKFYENLSKDTYIGTKRKRKSTRKNSKPSRWLNTTEQVLSSCIVTSDPKQKENTVPVLKIKAEKTEDQEYNSEVQDKTGNNPSSDSNDLDLEGDGFYHLSNIDLGDDDGDENLDIDIEDDKLDPDYKLPVREKDSTINPGRKRTNVKKSRRKKISTKRSNNTNKKKGKRKGFCVSAVSSLNTFRYNCIFCSKQFQLKSLMNIHLARTHNKFGIENCLCKALLNRYVKNQYYTKLFSHNSSSDKNKRIFQCLRCKKRFKYYSTLGFHIKKQHSINFLSQKNVSRKLINFLSIKKKFHQANIKKEKNKKRKEVKKKKNDGDVQCSLCFSYLSCERDLSNHMMKIHKMSNEEAVTMTGYPKFKKLGGSLSCTLCWEVFSTAKALKLHQKNIHKVKDVVPPCSECGKIFRSLYALKNHLRSIHLQRTTEIKGSLGVKIFCEVEGCDFSSPSTHTVNLHMVDNHPGVVYKCSECRFMCHLKSMLDKHYITTHRHRDKYFKIKCQVCDKTFGKKPHCLVHEFMKHGINHPSIKLHKCPFEGCEYVTVNKAILKTHELKHSEEKKFECQFCGTKLKTKTTYNKHIKKMHLGIRPHLCQICGATFGEDSELSAHINNKHSTEKQFQCEHCPYATSSKSTFFTHLFMVHKVRADEDKRKEYSCPHCNYVTVIKGRFKTHLNGHKNIRDHVCSECGKQFITRSTLVSHKQWVHSGKVHSCNQCDYRTKTVQKLNEHVRVQHQLRGFKPYRCPYCDFTCATGGNCRKHVKQRHREEEIKYIRDDSLIEAARLARQAGNYAPFIGNEKAFNTSCTSVIGNSGITASQPLAHTDQITPMNLNMIWM